MTLKQHAHTVEKDKARNNGQLDHVLAVAEKNGDGDPTLGLDLNPMIMVLIRQELPVAWVQWQRRSQS